MLEKLANCLVKLFDKLIDNIDNPFIIFLLIVIVLMGLYIWYKDRLLREKDDYIASLTEKVFAAAETLSRLTTLVETLVHRALNKTEGP